MKQMTLLTMAVVFLVALPAKAASHRMLRCRGGIVMVGTDKYEVLSKCGAPLNIEESSGGGANVKQERLLYRLSQMAPLKVITIRNGKVSDIESLD